MKITFNKARYNLVWEKVPLSRETGKIFPQSFYFFKYNLLLNLIESHSITLPQNQILSSDHSLGYYDPPDLKQTNRTEQNNNSNSPI